MAWTPPSDAISWSPPADAEEEEQGYLSRVASNILPGLETAGRMLSSVPAYIGGGLAGAATAIGSQDINAGRQVQEEVTQKLSPATYVPQSTKSAQIDEMMGAGMEKAGEIGGAVGQWLATPSSPVKPLPEGYDPQREEVGRSLGEFGAQAALNFAPIPGAEGVGKLMRGKASPYKALRDSHPELKDMTDAELIDFLEQKRKEPVKQEPQQGELFDTTPPEGQFGTADPLAGAREAAQGEVKSLDESAAFGRQELSGGQKELFPEATGLEKVDTGLEQPNKVVSSPVEPDGLSKGVEYGFEKNREPIKGTDVPDTTRPELRIQDPSEYTNTLPYSNTIHDYIYSRFPELTEKLQADPVSQRLMMEVNKWTDHLKETLDMGGSEFAAGMRIKNKNIELMPGVRVAAGKELGSTARSQAELNRLKAEYERSAQRLDLVVGQLSERLKSRSKAIGSDIANNAKFSDWVNEKLNSSGPDQGYKRTSITGEPYKEGAASANIQGQTLFGKGQRGAIDPDTFLSLIPKISGTRVVDAMGKLKQVFHGTSKDVPFKDVKANKNGAWFTDNPKDASSYAMQNDSQGHAYVNGRFVPTNTASRVMPVYLDIKNPLIVNDHQWAKDLLFKSENYTKAQREVVARAKSMGYDGIKIGGDLDNTWVAFDKSQIHSALSPNTKLGQTKIGGSQRGAIGFKPDTPFEKFEKSLPAPYKGRAKELWADLEAKKAKPDFIANKKEGVVADHIKTITGQEPNYVPITKPYKEIRDQILADKDINGTKVGQQLVSGAKMYAQQTKNLAIRFTADVVNASKKAQEVATYNKLFADGGIISSWEKLSKAEQAGLWDVIKKYKMKEWLDSARLREEGLNGNQIYAYNRGRQHLEQTINDINAERTAHGESEITPMPGYFPSRWKGNFYFEVHKLHEDGRAELVRIETGNWKGIQGKGGLAAVRDRFAKEHPEYQVGEIVERPRYGDQKQTYSLFDNLLDTIGRDTPDREVLDRVFEQYAAEQADKTRQFRRHFDINSGVEGYRGDSVAKSSYDNALDAIYSLEGYMRDAHNYIETKRAAREINAMLYDKDLTKAQPNAMSYIRQYWDFSNGVEPQMAKMFDYIPEQMARSVGLSRYTPKSLVQDMKRNMMIFFLGFNRPVFLLSQAVQSLQFMPAYMLRMKADLGIKGWDSMIVSAQTKGYFDTVMGMSKSEKMTPLGKEAHKFAVEQRIVDPHFLDEIKNSGSRVTNDLTKMVTGQTSLMWTEKFARSNAFYSFVHMLENSGLKGNDLFKAAADATDIAMTNYVTHERAMIYKHFGIVGDMASPLTTFKHNYFSQLYLYGKEALKNPSAEYAKPLLAFLTTAYVVGGYMGLPGRQELDWIIDMARAHGLVNPKTKNVTQTLASTTAKMQTGKDTVRYGVFSGATGMDVSPTFSAASLIPDHGVSQMFPVVTKAAEMAGNVAKVGGKELGRMFGGQGSTVVDRAQLLKSVTPPAFKAGAEMVNQNPRTGMIPNPNDHMTGDVRRGPPSITDKNWLASGLGTNSIPESEQRTAAYQSKLQEDAIKQAKQTIIGQVKDLQTSGKPWSKEAKQYVDLGGTMNELVNAVKQNQMDQQQTREQRQRGMPKNVNQGQKVQRMNEYGISK